VSPEEALQKRIADAQARRKAVVDAETLPKLEQRAVDMERLAELEELHGSERVLRVDIIGWKPSLGAATMMIALLPETSDSKFKRFQHVVNNPKAKPAETVDAGDTLAASCIVYPSRKDDAEKDCYTATVNLAPGVLAHVASQVTNWVQGKAIELGK